MARTKIRGAALKLMPQESAPAAPKKSASAPRVRSAQASATPEARAEPPIEAVVDGKRVVIEAQDEVVIQCGKASITLRRNGRVVIRGTYVETRAEGVNRVKGGSVQIN